MQHVAVSGELGSGKTSIAKALSARLGADVVSTGAIHRRIAAERGASALETNLIAEEDGSIDELIDGELVRLGSEPERLIFDSRMAWHFVPGALRIHLVVDPRVAAERMAGREATSVERYASVEEARAKAAERQASERRRFRATYDVDIDRLRNYHVVLDTTTSGVEELADLIEAIVAAPGEVPPSPHLLLGARRLAATRRTPDAGIDGRTGDGSTGDRSTGNFVRVAYARPDIAVLDGHDAITAALERGDELVAAVLVAEGDEEVSPGVTAAELVAGQASATA